MRILITILLLFCQLFAFSQELFCNVRVNSSQVQTSDRGIFNSMQTAMYEFLNNTKWTDVNVENEERIECTMLITITKKISNDHFEAKINVQSTRPIYNTTYKSTLLNYVDNNFRFHYSEQQPLEFSQSTHLSNLTSVLAYYVYIVLGLDFDTFSENGGIEYFTKAQKIVNNAQNAPESGWKAFESDKNRYWLVQDLLDSRYSDYHNTLYLYHRLGLDKLGEEPDDARYEITEAIENLKGIYRENPSTVLLTLFFDAKSEEIIKIFSEAFPNEQAKIIQTLIEVNPSNTSRYQSITKSNQNR
jgi:hypothetical protein